MRGTFSSHQLEAMVVQYKVIIRYGDTMVVKANIMCVSIYWNLQDDLILLCSLLTSYIAIVAVFWPPKFIHVIARRGKEKSFRMKLKLMHLSKYGSKEF